MDYSMIDIESLLNQAFGPPKPMYSAEDDKPDVGCPHCGSTEYLLDQAEADYVCTGCGVVLGRWLDDSPEWRNDMDEGLTGDRSRVGAPTSSLFNSCNLSTIIPKYGRMRRAAVIHEHMSMSYKDRALYKVFKEITRVCSDVFSAGSVTSDLAKEMYKDIKDQKITRGENHKALIACCVYYACKVNNSQRKKEEVCEAFQLDKSAFTQSSKIFLDLIQGKSYYEQCLEDSNSMRGVISRTLGHLPIQDADLRWKLVRCIEDTFDRIKVQGDGAIDSKTPKAIITALAFLLAEKIGIAGITKNDIKKYCVVSTVTLNKTITLIAPFV